MDKVLEAKKGFVYPSQLDGAHYCSESIFEIEKRRIFERSWIFAGTEASLKNDNDYFLLPMPGWSIIVGRYGGKIRAFENRCTHRSSRLMQADCGNRPLRCPFHGWCFNEKGVPSQIPHHKEFFDFNEAEREKLALTSFKIEKVGELIFVRMPRATESLKDYLGTLHESLRTFDGKWSAPLAPDQSEIQCNWKLMVEIALDDYHTSEVHPISLGVHGQPPANVHHFTYTHAGHQVMNVGNHPNAQKMTSAATVMFIFPNFFAVQFDGSVVAALSICPVRADQTIVRSFAFHERGVAVSSAFLNSRAKSVLATNLEDQRRVESVQTQIHRHRRGQPLGSIELPIYQFQRAYARKMSRFPFLAGLFSR